MKIDTTAILTVMIIKKYLNRVLGSPKDYKSIIINE